MSAVSAITGGIGLVGNLVGGVLGSSASSKAAKLQKDAADKAGQDVINTTKQVNPQITNSAATGANQVNENATAGAANVAGQAANAGANVVSSAGTANGYLNPYAVTGETATGELNKGLAEGGAFNSTPTGQQILSNDPGYQFRLQQGQLAMQRSRAAMGASASGAALKDLNSFSQNTASSEYGNAFNRYETDTQGRYNRLFGAAGQGQTAATQQGQNLIGANEYAGTTNTNAAEFGAGLSNTAAQYGAGLNYNAATTTAGNSINAQKTAADYAVGGANAAAAGKVGSANAWGSAIGGASNAVGGALTLSQLLKNPANKFNVNVGGH